MVDLQTIYAVIGLTKSGHVSKMFAFAHFWEIHLAWIVHSIIDFTQGSFCLKFTMSILVIMFIINLEKH